MLRDGLGWLGSRWLGNSAFSGPCCRLRGACSFQHVKKNLSTPATAQYKSLNSTFAASWQWFWGFNSLSPLRLSRHSPCPESHPLFGSLDWGTVGLLQRWHTTSQRRSVWEAERGHSRDTNAKNNATDTSLNQWKGTWHFYAFFVIQL